MRPIIPQLMKPERPGHIRRYSWCYKCGAPKWIEQPDNATEAQRIENTRQYPATCECNVGWHDGKPNKVFASNQPPGWHCRALVGIIDTAADIERYWLSIVRQSIESAIESADTAREECDSLNDDNELRAIDKELSSLVSRLSRHINNIKN